MEDAHKEAEAIRAGKGYSGGDDGSENKIIRTGYSSSRSKEDDQRIRNVESAKRAYEGGYITEKEYIENVGLNISKISDNADQENAIAYVLGGIYSDYEIGSEKQITDIANSKWVAGEGFLVASADAGIGFALFKDTSTNKNYFNAQYFEGLKDILSSWNKFNEPSTYFEKIFNSVKRDIINYGDDLRKLRHENKDEFDYLFESIDYLVSRIGVDEDIHYFRNELNKFSGAPDELDEMLKLAQKGEWILLSPSKSQLHMYGENGEYNLKFVSKEGRFEAVYDINNQLVVDDGGMGSINMGAYNYSTPNGNLPIGHVIYDVLPWYDWDNIKNEPEKGKSKYNDKNDKMKEYHNYYQDIINNSKDIKYYEFK